MLKKSLLLSAVLGLSLGLAHAQSYDAPAIQYGQAPGGGSSGTPCTGDFCAATAPLSGALGGTGVANTGKTVTLGGNLTTSGANNVTLTTSGATNVTLPTTGTLGTLAGAEALSNKAITSSTVDSTPIGSTTPAALKATTVWQSSRNALTDQTGRSPTSTSSATAVMMGLGSSWTLTPSFSGRVSFLITGSIDNATTGTCSVNVSRGTGAAPANAAAVTGTNVLSQPIFASGVSSTDPSFPITLAGEVTGLTLSTAYWWDINMLSSGGTCRLRNLNIILQEF